MEDRILEILKCNVAASETQLIKAAKELSQLIDLRSELIKFAEWYYCEQGGIDDFTVKYIDEYLKQKPSEEVKG